MKATLDHIEEVAHNFRTHWMKPERPLRYTAGQYIQISLPHDQPDERGQQRWFTLSSSPSEKMIAITTKFPEPDKQISSFKHTLAGLKPGDILTISEPMGDFVLPVDIKLPLLFVAGGAGITPYRSIIKWLVDSKQQRAIQLVYAVHGLEEVAFRDLFNNYELKFETVIGTPLVPEKLINIFNKDPRTLIYISGPELMVENFVEELHKLGVPNHQLVGDYFPGYN